MASQPIMCVRSCILYYTGTHRTLHRGRPSYTPRQSTIGFERARVDWQKHELLRGRRPPSTRTPPEVPPMVPPSSRRALRALGASSCFAPRPLARPGPAQIPPSIHLEQPHTGNLKPKLCCWVSRRCARSLHKNTYGLRYLASINYYLQTARLPATLPAG